MSWDDIISDKEFQSQPVKTKVEVALNYFNKNLVDDEYKQQPLDVQQSVKKNFLSTLQEKPSFESKYPTVSAIAETVKAVPKVIASGMTMGLSEKYGQLGERLANIVTGKKQERVTEREKEYQEIPELSRTVGEMSGALLPITAGFNIVRPSIETAAKFLTGGWRGAKTVAAPVTSAIVGAGYETGKGTIEKGVPPSLKDIGMSAATWAAFDVIGMGAQYALKVRQVAKQLNIKPKEAQRLINKSASKNDIPEIDVDEYQLGITRAKEVLESPTASVAAKESASAAIKEAVDAAAARMKIADDIINPIEFDARINMDTGKGALNYRPEIEPLPVEPPARIPGRPDTPYEQPQFTEVGYQGEMGMGQGSLKGTTFRSSVGAMAGVETDEQGNLTFNPVKAAAGALAAAAGIGLAAKYIKSRGAINPKVVDGLAISAERAGKTLPEYLIGNNVTPKQQKQILDLYQKSAKSKASDPNITGAAKMKAIFDESHAEAAARVTSKFGYDQIMRGMVDVSKPLMDRIERLDPELGKQIRMRHDLIKGADSRAAQMVEEAHNEIFGSMSVKDHEVLSNIIRTKRGLDIAGYKPDYKFSRGATPDDHADYLAKVAEIEGISPERAKQLIDNADKYFDRYRGMLKESLDEGLITKELHDKLVSHNYEPTEYFKYIDPELSYKGNAGTINVRESGIEKLKEGSEAVVFNDAEQLLAQSMSRMQSRIFKNRANKELAKLADVAPDAGIVRRPEPIGRNSKGEIEYESPKADETAIRVWENGESREVFIPNEVAKDWINSDPLITQQWANIMGWVSMSKPLKAVATGYNPAFILTNMPRDVALVWWSGKEYSSTAPKALFQMASDFAQTAKDVWKPGAMQKGVVADYISQGGGMQLMTHYGRYTGRGTEIAQTPTGKAFETLTDALGFLGERSELWTRMALRNRALKNLAKEGKVGVEAETEATWIARNYLDFSKGGNVAKAADTAIPYFNAAIQGTRGFARGFKDWKTATWKIGQLGALSSALYMWNKTTNPECWNEVSDRDKENNFIITTGYKYTDESGQEHRVYGKIAKEQGLRPFASMFEAAMQYGMEGKLPSKQLLMSIKDVLPMPGLPPTAAALAAYMLNKDTWTQEDIWKGTKSKISPEAEKYPTTNPAFVKMGEATGMSPVRMEASINKIVPLSNPLASGVLTGFDVIGRKEGSSYPEKSIRELVLKNPTTKRVLGSTNAATPYRDAMQEEEVKFNTARFKSNQQLDELYRGFKAGKISPDQIDQYVGQFDETEQDRLYKRLKHTKDFDGIPDKQWWIQIAGEPSVVRAKCFFARYINESADKRVQMLKIADETPGIGSDAFLEELQKLNDEHLKQGGGKTPPPSAPAPPEQIAVPAPAMGRPKTIGTSPMM